MLFIGEAHALAYQPLHIMGHLFIPNRKTEDLRHGARQVHHGQLPFPGFAEPAFLGYFLHKPGPLTNEEWIIMRRHPEIGRQILEQTGGVFQHLASIVVAHHERWDGHGYPRGLAAEAIPITARILSVVDAYDAMISRRPYREPLSIAEARAELQHCAGSQFDPSVVTAFLQVLDERKELQGALPGELARA